MKNKNRAGRDPLEDLKRRQESPERTEGRDPIADLEARQEGATEAEETEKNMQVIGTDQISEALATLKKYDSAMKELQDRIQDNEKWWKLKQWEIIRKKQSGEGKEDEPVSAWLFNSLANKHADAMDQYPTVNVLPREESDKQSAEALSSILPVVIEQAEYKKTYSDKWWYKLKQGSSCEAVLWNPTKNNGLGDIDIRKVDLLSLRWEPNINNIQDSKNLFYISLRDNASLVAEYPQMEGKTGSAEVEAPQTLYGGNAEEVENKTLIIDWYYKKQIKTIMNIGGEETPTLKTVVHFCKFAGDEVLYASENDPDYKDRGFYDHGKYPFVIDTLFPIENSPVGFGYIDVMKSAQTQIDEMAQALNTNFKANARQRYFISEDAGINDQDFADVSKPYIKFKGNRIDEKIIPVQHTGMDGSYVQAYLNKIDELKETSGNRDFSQGSTTSGVTAASAIAALQEAGSKLSRDMIQTSYTAYEEVCSLCVELIRQFYDTKRSFRIIGPNGDANFVEYDNSQIQPNNQGTDFGTDFGDRLPIFDIKVRAYKNNPFSRLSQNELALQFFQMGFFNPELADQATMCIDMMDFEGKDSLLQKISKNSMLFNQLQMIQNEFLQLAQTVDANSGTQITPQVVAMLKGGAPIPEANAAEASQNKNLGADAEESSTTEDARERVQNSAAPR